MARGTVKFWHDDEGWGAITDPDRPGLGFVLFVHVQAEGYRSLKAGQRVDYEWADNFEQDGCQWRVQWVKATSDP